MDYRRNGRTCSGTSGDFGATVEGGVLLLPDDFCDILEEGDEEPTMKNVVGVWNFLHLFAERVAEGLGWTLQDVGRAREELEKLVGRVVPRKPPAARSLTPPSDRSPGHPAISQKRRQYSGSS